MADVLTLQEVGRIVSYAAPGYAVYGTYRARFPAAVRPAAEVLIASTVLSLPFVALAQHLAPEDATDPTSLRFVAALLIPAWLAGLLLGWVRGWGVVRDVFEQAGFGAQAESSVWLRTLRYLDAEAFVTVQFKDGTRVCGQPRLHPGDPTDGIREIYLVNVHEWSAAGDWEKSVDGAGVIVRLDEAVRLTLSSDPLA